MSNNTNQLLAYAAIIDNTTSTTMPPSHSTDNAVKVPQNVAHCEQLAIFLNKDNTASNKPKCTDKVAIIIDAVAVANILITWSAL